MNAVRTFLDHLFFVVTCALGWVIFPVFITLGGIALLCYALIAECFSSMAGSAACAPASADRRDQAARRLADRLCGTLRP